MKPKRTRRPAATPAPAEAAVKVAAACPHCELSQMGTWTEQGILIECPCGKTSLRQPSRASTTTTEQPKKSEQSKLEESFRDQLIDLGLEGLFFQQYEFHPTRKFKADFAIPTCAILIDIEGGVWSNGRHTRGQGYTDDLARSNMAQLLGYTHLRYTGKEVKDRTAAAQVIAEINKRAGARLEE